MASLRNEMFGARVEPPRVDRFSILETLGAGGMGVVYAAFDPRLNRRVALKLVKPEVAATASHVEARLLREAQAMARLSHPNVVQIHEVGLWHGRVYIAMELVVGRSLAGWIEAETRDWRDVVRVFVEAGLGLAAAHSVGIVHRDFKPANVLVGDDGRIRVSDFGLARGELDTEEAPTAKDVRDPVAALAGPTSTVAGPRAGTPGYMSPEQFLGRTVTAASDQFSFCVALYHALHGQRPFAGDDRESLMRAVLAGAIQAPARLRIPRRIHRALVRGLAREPEARFPTMQALLAAIAVRSPWRAVFPAALFFAAGLGVSGVALYGDPCADDGALLANAWDPSTRAAAQYAFAGASVPDAPVLWASASRMVDDYSASVSRTFVQSCEAQRRGESSQELHDLRVACLRRRVAVVRGIAGAMIGGETEALRNATQAASQLGELGGCEDERALLLGMDPPPPAQIGELTRIRGIIDQAHALELLGDLKASEALAADAVAAARRSGHAATLAEALFIGGRLALHAHEYRAAEDALREALELAMGARHDALVGELWSWRITANARRRDDVQEAREWLRLADVWLGRGETPLLRAALERARGIVHQIAGEHADAKAASQRALEIREQVFGPEHLEVAIERYNHANSLDVLGFTDEAIEAYQRALAVIRRDVGDRHELTADVHYNLGVALVGLGTPEALAQAEVEFLRHRAVFEGERGPDAPELAKGSLALAKLALMREDLDGADRWLREAEVNHARNPGRPQRALVLGARGALEFHRDHLGESFEAHRTARALAIAAWGPMSDLVGAADTNIADILQSRGDFVAALRRYDSAIVVLEHALGPESADLVAPLLGRGDALIALGRACDAIAGIDRALMLLERREAVAADLDEVRQMRSRAAERCGER